MGRTKGACVPRDTDGDSNVGNDNMYWSGAVFWRY